MTIFRDRSAGQIRVPGLSFPATRGGRNRLFRWMDPAGRLAILLLVVLAVCPAVRAGQSVYLSWAPSPDSAVIGYKIYYGGSSGNYTNFVLVGNVTNSTISGLSGGTTYYFAGTAVDASGDESGFSTEVSYYLSPVTMKLGLTMAGGGLFQLAGIGLAGHTYEIQASTNLVVWEIIGTQTPGTNGLLGFTDDHTVNYPMRFYRVRDTQP